MILRVLQVIPSTASSEGGPSHAISVIERALCQRGIGVVTLTTDHGLNLDVADASAQLNRVHASLWSKHYKIAPSATEYLWRHCADFDVIHIHALFSFIPTMAAWISRLRRVPYIVRPLGTLNGYGLQSRRPGLKRLSIALNERLILRNASAVHFTSRAEEEEARGLGLNFRSAIIPLAVEGSQSPAAESIASLAPMFSSRSILLYMSRIDPKKNIECVIDALATSPWLAHNCGLLVAGDGDPEYVANLKARADAAGVGASIVWLGHVQGERKAAAFALADVFVLPSHSENFGIAAIEAMLAGVPCVLTPGVAIAEEAAAAGGAILIENDSTALACAVEGIITDEERRIRMGALALHHARHEYSVEMMAERLIKLYRSVKQHDENDEPVSADVL